MIEPCIFENACSICPYTSVETGVLSSARRVQNGSANGSPLFQETGPGFLIQEKDGQEGGGCVMESVDCVSEIELPSPEADQQSCYAIPVCHMPAK